MVRLFSTYLRLPLLQLDEFRRFHNLQRTEVYILLQLWRWAFKFLYWFSIWTKWKSLILQRSSKQITMFWVLCVSALTQFAKEARKEGSSPSPLQISYACCLLDCSNESFSRMIGMFVSAWWWILCGLIGWLRGKWGFGPSKCYICCVLVRLI